MADVIPITRRTILAGTAATATVATAAVPGIGSDADPIFAAIERHIEACRIHEAACDVSGDLRDDDPRMPEARE
jgi:hypothetical protein